MAVDKLDNSSKPIDKRLIQLLKWNSGHQEKSKAILTETDGLVDDAEAKFLKDQQSSQEVLDDDQTSQLVSNEQPSAA